MVQVVVLSTGAVEHVDFYCTGFDFNFYKNVSKIEVCP